MVSSQINNLTEEELNYLENLLGREYAEECENARQWKTKNGYNPPDNSKTLLRLINAVRSQRNLVKMPKW